jgi:hypothetical protein
LLLNPDIRIFEGTVFTEMLACLESQHKVAVVAPLQFKEKTQGYYLNFTWSYLSPHAFKFYMKKRIHYLPVQAAPIKVSFLNAGCLMLRRMAFEQVGKLNEKYFLYGEEPDLFLKFKRFGYECRLLPNARIIHYRERSISKVEPLKRLSIRVKALRNIIQAFVNGWGHIYLDRISKRFHPKHS